MRSWGLGEARGCVVTEWRDLIYLLKYCLGDSEPISLEGERAGVEKGQERTELPCWGAHYLTEQFTQVWSLTVRNSLPMGTPDSYSWSFHRESELLTANIPETWWLSHPRGLSALSRTFLVLPVILFLRRITRKRTICSPGFLQAHACAILRIIFLRTNNKLRGVLTKPVILNTLIKM